MIQSLLSFIIDRLRRLRRRTLSTDRDVALVQRVRGRRLPSWRQLRHMVVILPRRECLLFFGSFGLCLLSGAWLLLALFGRFQTVVPDLGGTYVEAIVGTPRLVNPLYAPINDTDMDLSRLLFRGLFRLTATQELVPDLVERFEESPDKKQYTFFLRNDARWHDGEPVTARDVVFTIEAIQNPETNSPLFVTFQGIRGEALDDHTFRAMLPESFPAFLTSLTVGILPEHIWGAIPPSQISLAAQNSAPIGNGPFRFGKLIKNETGVIRKYELRRFDDFYGGAPYLASVVFSFFPSYTDPGANPIDAFREREADGIGFVPRSLVERVTRKDVVLHTLHLPQYTALFLNQDRAPALQDHSIRNALLFAVDKERIVQESLKGEGQTIEGPILPGYSGEASPSSYNVLEANRLLDEGGWNRVSFSEFRNEERDRLILEWKKEQSQATGKKEEEIELSDEASQAIEQALAGSLNEAQTFFRKKKDGAILELVITTSNAPELIHTAELVAGFWQEIGVRTRVESADSRELSRQKIKKRDYDVLLYGVLIGADPDQFAFWHSSQKDFPGLNLSRYVNRKADELLQKIRETSDPSLVAQLSRDLDNRIKEDSPALFLYTPTYTYATHEKVRGITADRIAHPSDRFVDIERWYMRTKRTWSRPNE